MITVFYDGACGLCAKEITHYQKIASNGVFIWCDVMQTPQALENLDVSLVEALEILHAQDHEGQLHQGIDAFILMWDHLPRWRLLAKITRFPVVYALSKKVYAGFAAWRFKRLAHCQMAVKQDADESS